MQRMIILMKAFTNQMNKKHISAYASSCAFFFFLSLIPILLLVCAILPYTPLTEENLIFYLDKILPTVLSPVAIGFVEEMYERSIALVSITAIAALWAAGKGMLALIRGLNVVFGVEETRNYFVLRIRSSIYTLVMLLAVLASLMVIVFGKVIVNVIIANVPQLQYFLEFLLGIRHVFYLLLLEVMFVAIFAWLPNGKMKWRNQIPGAFLVSVGWTLFSMVFSAYVNRFIRFSMYGSLTTIIISMLWLYVCMYIVFIGALVNQFFTPLTEHVIGEIGEKQKSDSSK